MKKKQIELTAPAGNFESLMAAIKAGADSVYFGVKQLNMRSHGANNFNISELKRISAVCRKNRMKSYLTLNTIIYDKDIKLMKKICNAAKKAGINAIVACDVSVMKYADSIGMEVHLSTQANVSNIEAVKFYSRFADVIVLARELTLEQIKNICSEIKKQKIKGPSGNPVRIEVFIHGALCVSIAGKCYMSLGIYNKSANRGECLQNCRRRYRIIDDDTGDELLIENRYVMSPKDLCTIRFIDRIIESGVSILKIEGRARAADYVYTTTKVYREAINSYYNNSYNKNKIIKLEKELSTVFNRGFWHGGYYLGKKLGEWSGAYGSKATKEKIFIGTVRNYFNKKKIGLFYVETGTIRKGDDFLITGPTTGTVFEKIKTIFRNNRNINSAGKGDLITIPIKEKIRRNDKLYLLREKSG